VTTDDGRTQATELPATLGAIPVAETGLTIRDWSWVEAGVWTERIRRVPDSRIALGSTRVIPGHDPYVMKEYPAPKPSLAGIAVRLDSEPIAPALAFPGTGH
jgi:hypothetical protein